jgi:hypothetical protein
MLIIIEGGPCSGKTTLIKKLQEKLGTGEVVNVPKNDYEKLAELVQSETRKSIVLDWDLWDRRQLAEFLTKFIQYLHMGDGGVGGCNVEHRIYMTAQDLSDFPPALFDVAEYVYHLSKMPGNKRGKHTFFRFSSNFDRFMKISGIFTI